MKYKKRSFVLGTVHEMTIAEGKSKLDKIADLYDSLGEGFPDDDELSNYPYLDKSKMTGRSLSEMVKEYPSNAEMITTKEQSSLEFEELQKSLSEKGLNIANQFLSKGQ